MNGICVYISNVEYDIMLWYFDIFRGIGVRKRMIIENRIRIKFG